MSNKTFFKQVGGEHYKLMKIQPSVFINENNLLFAEGNAIKYICRHRLKGKKEDILKAIHYLEMEESRMARYTKLLSWTIVFFWRKSRTTTMRVKNLTYRGLT